MITENRINPREVEQHKEGEVAKAIEHQTAKLPSDFFMWAAGASMLGALTLKVTGRERDSQFVGLWAPTFLMLGVYNKIVKVMGSDRTEPETHGRDGDSGQRYTR